MIKNIFIKYQTLLLTKKLDHNPKGGRELLCKLNYDALRSIFGHQLIIFELPQALPTKLFKRFNAFNGYIDGLDEKNIASAISLIKSENVQKVFVDGSNFGIFVEYLKKNLPNIEITVFFHNVEARFFLGSFRQQKSLRALAVLAVNYLAEKKAVSYSDKIICMSERDSGLLQKIYGRPATHVSSMALEDKMPINFVECAREPHEKFALFVGGIFYANHAGISWFVRNVVPRINMKIYIVGHGFDAYRAELEIDGKVEVVGSVDNLADWYREAQFVIAPIFDGSGMKTKVAEALMYGKKIIGTPEAFSGYEDVVNRVGWCCETADDFVAAISSAQSEIKLSFDWELRRLYEKKYSLPAAKARLAQILDVCNVPY